MISKQLRFTALIFLLLGGCKPPMNPFYSEWDTPFGVPPFGAIALEHYAPAFQEGMHQQAQEIDAIVSVAEPPTFANTIEAYDRSGALLSRVNNVFFALNEALTSDEMQAVAKDVAPKLSKHSDEILLNDKLFQRVKAIYDQRENLSLNGEQRMLLKKTYERFVRAGANLTAEQKERMKAINEELSVLTLQFGENVLKEINTFELVLAREADLAGLPEGVVAAAREAAAERGYKEKWLFTLHVPSITPFLQYSERRDLREKIYKAYITKGDHGNAVDNKDNIKKIVALRIEKAKLLGFPTHADYVLDQNMAKNPASVRALLKKIWDPAIGRAKAEVYDMQKVIDHEKGGFALAPWDWWYYAEKVKKAKYALDEEMLRPYFELAKVRDAAFDLAGRLYGLRFREIPDAPKYHEDVKVFEVQESDGAHVGVLYVDYFPRASKRGGAWMDSFREQSKRDGKFVSPVIYNVGNFTKPTADQPSLLSVDEVNTLFHEFGHALHGLLSNCTYETLSGTKVARDFVELPSQIMENWAFEPEFLKTYARHFKTGEPIPDALIEKIRNARHFNQGFATTEYLAASFLDLDWHTLTAPVTGDVDGFEKESLDEIGLIPEITSRYRSTYFNHIFSGGYSAGYYAYIWAEVLDADAFQAFKETGNVFDPATARSFRENILSRGATEEPMVLYKQFRGKEPTIEPLLAKRGLK
jgi:peptidyl-dipeptidase Dcp